MLSSSSSSSVSSSSSSSAPLGLPPASRAVPAAAAAAGAAAVAGAAVAGAAVARARALPVRVSVPLDPAGYALRCAAVIGLSTRASAGVRARLRGLIKALDAAPGAGAGVGAVAGAGAAAPRPSDAAERLGLANEARRQADLERSMDADARGGAAPGCETRP